MVSSAKGEIGLEVNGKIMKGGAYAMGGNFGSNQESILMLHRWQ